MKKTRYSGASVLNTMFLRRRSSYRLLFLAVLLSTFLAGATVLMISTGRASYYELNFTRYGEEDFIMHNAAPAFLRSLVEKGIIRENYGTLSIYGFTLPDGESAENGFSIAAMDANAEQLAHRRLREGRLPERPGEIAVERIALKKSKLKAEVGDTLSLMVQLPDGEGGFLPEPAKMDFTLVGILEDQYPYILQVWGWGDPKAVYMDVPSALVDPAEPMPAGGAFVFNGLIDFTRNPEMMPTDLYNALAEWKKSSGQDTKCTLIAIRRGGFVGSDHGILDTTAVFAFALGTLLLLCAVGIVASFSATIEERTHQLALFRAVGATRVQLLRMLLTQTLTLTLIAVPLGFALSVAAVYGLVKLLGGFFRFVWDGWAVFAAIAAMFLSVLIAALIPAWKASRISPMQVIRDVDMQYAMRRSKINSRRSFRPSVHLALRNLTLHRGGWGGVLALTLIAVLIVCTVIPYAVNGIRNAVVYNKHADYMLWTWSDAIGSVDGINKEYPYKLLTAEKIEEIRSVFQDQKTDFVTRRQLQTVLHLDEITEYMKFRYMSRPGQAFSFDPNNIAREMYRLRHFEGEDKEQFASWIESYSSLSFVKFPEDSILEGEIHPEKIASREEVVVYAPYWATEWDTENDGIENGRGNFGPLETLLRDGYTNIHENDTFHAGDRLTFSLLAMPEMLEGNATTGYTNADQITQQVQTVTIGAVVTHSESPGYDLGNIYKILTVDSALDAWGWEKPDPDSVYISLSERPPEGVERYYDDCLEEIVSVIDRGQYANNIENAELSRDNNRSVILIASGIALIFFAATAALVNRTLSAQIRGSARTIGMLRAVGADRGSIARMYGLQVLIVLLLGSVIGFVLGLILSQIQQFIDFPLKEILPIAAVLVPVYLAALIGLCMLHVHARIGEIYRKSVTENIREL